MTEHRSFIAQVTHGIRKIPKRVLAMLKVLILMAIVFWVMTFISPQQLSGGNPTLLALLLVVQQICQFAAIALTAIIAAILLIIPK